MNATLLATLANETSRATFVETSLAAQSSTNQFALDTYMTSVMQSVQANAHQQETFFSGNVSALQTLPTLADYASTNSTIGSHFVRLVP